MDELKLRAAIKVTEYKYFGDYEMSDDQREAVDVLVAAAEELLSQSSRPVGGEAEPVAWMYHMPGDLGHGWQRFEFERRIQSYEGMSCNEEDAGMIETPLYAHPAPSPVSADALDAARATSGQPQGARWGIGDLVQKKRGSAWRGKVVGFYVTEHTPIGYAVESLFETGSVQVWPEAALEPYAGEDRPHAH